MATYKPKKKIDNNGTLEDVKIPIESVDGLADEFKKKGVHFISDSDITTSGGSNATSRRWVVNNVDGITEPFDGMIVALRTPEAQTLNNNGIAFSIDNGLTYHALTKPSGDIYPLLSPDAGSYPAMTTVVFIYNSTKESTVTLETGVQTKIVGCWQHSDFNSDKNVEQRFTDSSDEFPVLIKFTKTLYGTPTSHTQYSKNVRITPSTGTLSATAFKENGVSLSEKYALKDEAGSGLEKLGFIDFCPSDTATDTHYDSVGIFWEESTTNFRDKDNNELNNDATTFHRVPIASGEGIEFEKDEDYQVIKIKTDLPSEEVEAVDLPTVRAKLKPASEVGGGLGLESVARIDSWANTPTDIENLGQDGVAWNEDFEFYDKDDNTISYGTMAHRIPICAGAGIEFIQETDAPVVSINATGGGGNKPPSYIKKSVDYIETFDSSGIYYGTNNSYYNGYDLDTDLLGEGTEETAVPISAGDGIVFEQDDENHSVKISANNHYKSFTKNLDVGLNSMVDFIGLDSHGCIGKCYCYFGNSFTFRNDSSSSGETLLGGLYEIIQFNFNVYIKNIADNSVITTTANCAISAINGNTTVECATQIIRQGE